MASNSARPVEATAPQCCPHCGALPTEQVIKRGAIAITSNPDEVFWCDRRVPLSPTEAHLFRQVAIRGRATYRALEEALTAFGSSPATRSIVMLRIRQKFVAIGGENPFARIGANAVGLRTSRDANGSSGTVIGLQLDAEAIARFAHE